MSTGAPGYFHPETGTLGVGLGVEAYRGVSAQLWTVPHSPSTNEGTTRTYHHAMYVGPTGGLPRCPEDAGPNLAGVTDLSSRQPRQRTDVHLNNQLYPIAGRFTGHPRHDASHVYDAFSEHPGHTSQSDTKASPALGFTPTSQTWEDMVSTGLMSQANPLRLYPSQLHARMPYSAHRNQHHSFNPQSTHNEEDFYAFRCEWSDERGNVCNMQIAGDRVSMSHHLSRHHDVTGDEKSQRPCLWRGCTETMNKGSLARHVVSRHLRAGTSCGFCSKVYSRADVARRHTKKCKAANVNARVEDKDDVMR